MPPRTTRQRMSSPAAESTSSSRAPSAIRIRSPSLTSSGSSLYWTGIRSSVLGTSARVRQTVSPFCSNRPSSAISPIRILGPGRSCSIATLRPNSADILRTLSITRRCCRKLPCEKLRRTTSIPARINPRMTSSDSLAGPMVHMIFVFRTFPSHMKAVSTGYPPYSQKNTSRRKKKSDPYRNRFAFRRPEVRPEVHYIMLH